MAACRQLQNILCTVCISIEPPNSNGIRRKEHKFLTLAICLRLQVLLLAELLGNWTR